MMKVIIFLALIALATAHPNRLAIRRDRRDLGPVVPPNYNFEYQIADSGLNDIYGHPSSILYRNYYGHKESRLGDDTQGSYYVRLPGDDSYTLFAYRVNPNGLNDPLVTLPPVPPKK